MQTDPYLFYNGNCEEAFKFYEKALGGKIEAMMPHKGTPAEKHVGPEWGNKIIHARIKIGNQIIMASDAPPGNYKKPQGFRVCLHVDSPADAEKYFKAFSEGGKVDMPLDKTFFAKSFGMLTDRFDIPWMIICD